MKKVIIIDGLIYRLKASDYKKFEALSSEPDKKDMRGNRTILSTSENLYSFLFEITEKYTAIGAVVGNFNL